MRTSICAGLGRRRRRKSQHKRRNAKPSRSNVITVYFIRVHRRFPDDLFALTGRVRASPPPPLPAVRTPGLTISDDAANRYSRRRRCRRRINDDDPASAVYTIIILHESPSVRRVVVGCHEFKGPSGTYLVGNTIARTFLYYTLTKMVKNQKRIKIPEYSTVCSKLLS